MVALAAQSIKAGDAEVIIAGGIENMSAVPYYLPKARWGARMFNAEMVDGMVYGGLWEIFNDYHMGLTSENIAEKYGITRKEQDEFALMSYQRALALTRNGNSYREKVILLSSFFIIRAPGGVGAFWVVTCPTPIPFAAITQKYVHS